MNLDIPPAEALGKPLPNWQACPFPARQAMHGCYCSLQPLSAEQHAVDLFAANAQDASGRNWRYLPYGPFADFASYQAWLATQQASSDPLFFAIVNSTSAKAEGVASYLRIEPKVGCIEVGHIHYSPLLQATRAATEAMYLMMANVFALGYRRYEWKCDTLNAPSRAAAVRFGFQFEGVFRQATIVKGRNRDTAWYSVIDSDWLNLRPAYERWLAPENFDTTGRQKHKLREFFPPGVYASGL